MIVPDANVLLYAYDTDSAHHAKARQWIEDALSADEPVRLPWQTVGAFLRIVTNPSLKGDRFSGPEALDIVDTWLAQPNVRMLGPGERHWPLLRRTVIGGQVRGPMVTDAQLAALAIECGGTLYTTDLDFARFADLKWRNPLSEKRKNGHRS